MQRRPHTNALVQGVPSPADVLRKQRFGALLSQVDALAPGCAYFHHASIRARKEALVQHILNHRQALNCGMATATDIASAKAVSSPDVVSGIATRCSHTFNSSSLPFRWLPGLRFRTLPERYYTEAHRFEVMHMFDWAEGPVWLYAAPGSGVWWSPGRTVFARNLVAAVLKFRPLQEVARHVARSCAARPALLQWKLAFGNTSWDTILSEAATGRNVFSLVAQADVFVELLTPPPNVDSVVLLEQMHVFPRWGDDYYYGTRLVHPMCANHSSPWQQREWSNLHYVPEVVDFRVRLDRQQLLRRMRKRQADWVRAAGGQIKKDQVIRQEYNRMVLQRMRKQGIVSSSVSGAPCPDWSRGRGTLCTSCSKTVHVLCECATSPRFGATADGREVITDRFDARQARACCLSLNHFTQGNTSTCLRRCAAECLPTIEGTHASLDRASEERCTDGCRHACMFKV